MGELIHKGRMYYQQRPHTFMPPVCPENYQVVDDFAPGGRYIVNIQDAAQLVIDTINDNFVDMPVADKNKYNEYWIEFGVYIHALWQQPWIKAICQARKGLFCLSDNIEYFFDKCRLCMAPTYIASDKVKLMEEYVYIITILKY